MLITPQVQEFEYDKPNMKIYRIPKLNFQRSMSEKKQRSQRILSQTHRKLSLNKKEIQDDMKKIQLIDLIHKQEDQKKEMFSSIRQTIRDSSNTERGSINWIKSFCNNEKIKISNLITFIPTNVNFQYNNFRQKQNSKNHISVKRKLIDLPQQQTQQINKQKSQISRLRIKSNLCKLESSQQSVEIIEEPKQTKLQQQKTKSKKNINIDFPQQQQEKKDIFDEMLEFYNSDRIVNVASDIMKKKVDLKKVQRELIKTLQYIGRLKLDIYQAFSDQVISQKPFQKLNSYEFIQSAKQGKEWEVKEFLKENKFLVHDFDYIYMTALHWACKRGHFEIVKLLLINGSDVEFVDIIGRPALYFAIIGGNSQIVKIILDYRANPWSNNQVNYNQLCNEYNPSFLQLIANARKAHITLKMTPHNQRESIWKYLRR